MKKYTENDVKEFEQSFGESLCDSNHWHSNPFTILGFAYGLSQSKPQYEPLSRVFQREVDKNGYDAELFCPSLYEDAIKQEIEDEELACGVELEVNYADTQCAADKIYYSFIVEVLNGIAVYGARFQANINEMNGIE